jgi:hypothetical protein
MILRLFDRSVGRGSLRSTSGIRDPRIEFRWNCVVTQSRRLDSEHVGSRLLGVLPLLSLVRLWNERAVRALPAPLFFDRPQCV